MTYEAFIVKYLGKFVEWDNNSAKNQCVDFVKAYIENCLGIPTKGSKACWGNAKEYWLNTNSKLLQKCKKIANTPSFVPRKGDICIWTNGKYGHIAVASGDGDTRYFFSYDQNYPTGSEVKRVKHNYSGFAGVLRPYELEASPKLGRTATTTTALNVRTQPTTSSKIVKTLKQGTIVNVLDRIGNWVKIGDDMYCSATYLKLI